MPKKQFYDYQGKLALIRSAVGGDEQRGDKGALCRCGASQNRPYSDGSHVATGFRAD